MTGLRVFLIAAFVAIAAYSLVVGSHYGWNIIPLFFEQMWAMTWPGQFDLDFSFYLLLSGLWIAWRDRFSPLAIALGIIGIFGGMLFLSAYLLVLSLRAGGDIATVFLGQRRTLV